MGLRVNARIEIPSSELHESFVRSTGPGGQNVNKLSTKVELRWHLASSTALGETDRAWLLRRLEGKLSADGDLIVTSDLTRNQSRNRQDARDKLAEVVREGLRRPKKRQRTKPTRASVERRLDSKRRRSHAKRTRARHED